MAVLKPKRSVVVEANESVSIATACRLIGMELPDDIEHGRAVKVHCPFGNLWHSDQGIEPTMRLYIDNNTAFCFSRCGFFTPVTLAAMAWDLTRTAAAGELLERVGYKPVTLADTWASLTACTDPPDRAVLSAALKTYCARITPGWDDMQFEPTVAGRLTRCLALLELVHTDDEARAWLAGCKEIMQRVLTDR